MDLGLSSFKIGRAVRIVKLRERALSPSEHLLAKAACRYTSKGHGQP